MSTVMFLDRTVLSYGNGVHCRFSSFPIMEHSNVTAAEQLLKELEGLSERSDQEAKDARRELWTKLATAVGKQTSSDLVSDLGRRLDVQPITLRRWISGEYAPRHSHLGQIRSELGISPPPAPQPSVLSPKVDPPLPFDGGFAALRTLNHLFYCLQRASAFFIFKGMQSFRVGRSQQVRERVVQILQSSPDLRLYYVYREKSEAEQSIEAFLARQFVKDSGISDQIRQVPLSAKEDFLALGVSPASPFVIRYARAGLDEFKRDVDVWYELPVEQIDINNQVVDYGTTKSVFVQLPEEESVKIWTEWRPHVKSLLERKNIEFTGEFVR